MVDIVQNFTAKNLVKQPQIEVVKTDVTLALTHRERDTILAALRLWQGHLEKPFIDGATARDLMAVADGGRMNSQLSVKEIDVLIETRINA